MKPETRFWQRFKRRVPEGVHVTRIENWAGAGVADVNTCYIGQETWIELKCATQTGRVRFQQFQIPWLLDRAEAGGRVFVLIDWRREPVLVPARHVETLQAMGLQMIVNNFPRGKDWEKGWEHVIATLF